MTRLTVVTAASPDQLLRAAAAPLLCEGRPSEPLPILAVRQGGLRDEVHELAARAGCTGWLGKPVVVFAELPQLIAGELDALDEFQRRAVIERVMEAESPRTLPGAASRTMSESLERLFGDLVADSVEPEALAAALQHAGRDAWELGRDDDLRRLYTAYRREVAALGHPEGRDSLALAARAIRESPDAVRQRLRRPFDTAAAPRALHIYGLADLRRGWGALLQALRASSAVSAINVYLLDGADAFIAELKPDAIERLETAPAAERSRVTATATAAPDLSRELDHVARCVKRLIVEEGARPHEIAVVARKARPHLTRAAAAFAAHGIPVHARLRHTLTEIPAVAAMLRLFRIASDGWRVKDVEALAASPYFSVPLDQSVMRLAAQTGFPRGLAGWRTALADLRTRAAQAGDADDSELPPLERVARAIDSFDAFARTAERLGTDRTVAEWIALTRSIIDAPDTEGFLHYGASASPELPVDAPRELRDAVRLDEAALVSTLELLDAWRRSLATARSERAIGAGEWAAVLADTLDENEVTVRTGAPGGVHLLEALATAGRSFKHVFVLGLESGAFPANPSPNVFFADGELVRLAQVGLPMEASAVWLAREADLFASLEAAARESFHLTWAYADANGSPQLASAFAEDAMVRYGVEPATIPGSAVVANDVADIWSPAEALEYLADRQLLATAGDDIILATAKELLPLQYAQASHAVAIERARTALRTQDVLARAELANAWNGDVSDEASRDYLARRFADRVWSATQLERIGRCGFSFLAGTALGVRSPGDIDPDDADARDIGSARHAALARTYPRIGVTFGGGAPGDLQLAKIRQVVQEEVEGAIAEQGGAWTRLEGLRRARVRELVDELVAYIAWEMEGRKSGNVERTMLAAEVAFGMEEGGTPAVVLDAGGGRTIRLKGQIDRVDEVHAPDGVDYRYIVDHKSSAGALEPRGELEQAGAVLQLALYIKAAEQLEPGVQLWGGTYQIVRRLERKVSLERCGVAGGKVKTDGVKRLGYDATIQAAPIVAADLVDTVLAGKLPPRPPGKTDCLTYCDLRDVCRGDRLKPKAW